jgi:hypothetical protein
LLQDHRPPPAMPRNVTFGEIVSRLGCEGISLRFRAGAGAQVFKDINGAANSWSRIYKESRGIAADQFTFADVPTLKGMGAFYMACSGWQS